MNYPTMTKEELADALKEIASMIRDSYEWIVDEKTDEKYINAIWQAVETLERTAK